jgi:hypothetical protein
MREAGRDGPLTLGVQTDFLNSTPSPNAWAASVMSATVSIRNSAT